MTDAKAEKIAQAIYAKLSELKGPWVHHENEFLPANVCCDYAGQRAFINVIKTTLREPDKLAIEDEQQ